MDFPGEMRNQIYAILFEHHSIRLGLKGVFLADPGYDPPLRYNLHFLLTCWDIYKEAKYVIFERATFVFQHGSDISSICDMVHPEQRARIKSICFEISNDSCVDDYDFGWILLSRHITVCLPGLQKVSINLYPSSDRWNGREWQLAEQWMEMLEPLRTLRHLKTGMSMPDPG